MRRAVLLIPSLASFVFLGSCGSTNGNNGSPIAVTIKPAFAIDTVSQTTAFADTVTGTANTAVTWEVNNMAGGSAAAGTISATGVYTAPAQVPSPATVTVSVVSQADTTKSASAQVTVVAHSPNEAAQSLPIKLGTTGGNANDSSRQGNTISCCGGTLGSLVQRAGTFYILSNNHVLARSDSASLGENIIQPGLVDTNCSATSSSLVGNLSQFPNLQAAGTNVDAAIAKIISGAVDTTGTILSLGSTSTGGVPDPGPPHAGAGIAATVGMAVGKSGRTTGLTCSRVSAVAVATSVQYQTGCGTGTTFMVTYSNQISVSGGTFSGAGDSGSLIVSTSTADPVALLYGGSDTDSVGNPVQDVLNAMADSLGNKPVFVGSASAHQVIGCTLAGFSAASTNTARDDLAASSVGAQSLAAAESARDRHANELLANPYVRAVGIGASLDRPGEPAVLIVVDPGQPRVELPAVLDGIRTRIVNAESNAPRGLLEEAQSAPLAAKGDIFSVSGVSEARMAQAKAVHAAHVDEWMKKSGVQGFGISSSADAPGEAALMIFLIRGVPHDSILPVIDGVRTRVRESSRFQAGFGEKTAQRPCSVPARKRLLE
ncbi:MAG TPA: hypothetical protein VJN92_12150 [Candidatus Acidoferrum sp.]|nr:hypothetical protein [Candidatus Acidoferrum sp.]